MTTIQDVITYIDGSTANGRLAVAWKPFTVGGVNAAGGELEWEIVDGAVSVSVYSNTAALPLGSYYVAKYELENGAVYVEYWQVPDLPTVNLGQVRVSFPPTPSVMISPSQLSSLNAQPGMFLTWDGQRWVPGYPSSISINPNYILVAAGTSGSDVNVVGSPVSLGSAVTIHVPDAGAAARGVVTTGTQVFAGNKAFTGAVTLGSLTVTGTVVLPPDSYVPVSRKILTGAGLSGGGDLTADRTLLAVPMGASGSSHAAGVVPDPGSAAGATRYLREDASWVVPAGAGGGTPTGSSGQVQFNNASAFGASANLFWDITNSRLGIGTTSPQVRLSVTGPSQGNAGSGNQGIAQFTTGTGNYVDEHIEFGIVDGSYAWIQAIKPGAVTRSLALNPLGGNVGIGTTSPSGPLHIREGTDLNVVFAANAGLTSLLAVNNAGSGFVPMSYVASLHNFAGGNVGIGTENPLQPLSIIAGTPTTAATSTQLSIGEATNNSQYRLTLGYGSISGPGWAGCIQVTAGGSGYPLLLQPSGGVVGIGTTSPAYALDVTGSVNCSGQFLIAGTPIGGSSGAVQSALCSSVLTATGSLQDVPGCTLTLSRAGRWVIIAFFDMTCAGLTDVIQGYLIANGTQQSGTAWAQISGGNSARGMIGQSWVYFNASSGIVVKLQAWRSAGSGTDIVGLNTSITATWVSAT